MSAIFYYHTKNTNFSPANLHKVASYFLGPHKPRLVRLPRRPFRHRPGLTLQPSWDPGEDVRGAVRPDAHAGQRAHVPAPADAVHAGRSRPARATPRAQVAAVSDTS